MIDNRQIKTRNACTILYRASSLKNLIASWSVVACGLSGLLIVPAVVCVSVSASNTSYAQVFEDEDGSGNLTEEELSDLLQGLETGDNKQDNNNGAEETPLFGQPEDGTPTLFGEPANDTDNPFAALPPDEPADENELVGLDLRSVAIQDLADQIARWSAKPVWIDPLAASKTITLVNGQLLTKREALDLLFVTIHETQIAVIDRVTYIALVPIVNLQLGDAPLLGPDDDVVSRTDRGMIAEKIYQIEYGTAANIVAVLQDADALPQYAKVRYDEDSNQIVVLYNIGTLQRIARLIEGLDVPNEALQMQTFHLRYRDAEAIAQLIVDLFSAEENSNSGGLFGRNDRNTRVRQTRSRTTPQPSGVATTNQLRVTFDKQHNSVTVRAEREVISQIGQHIIEEWDILLSTPPITRFYELQNSDAVKVRDILRDMFSIDSDSIGTIMSDLGSQRSGSRSSRSTGSASSEGTSGLHPLAGQFSFEADQDANRLIVIARSADYFYVIDELMSELDRISTHNVPMVYPLKYAGAEDMAEQLNAIFAEAGTGNAVGRTAEGLTQEGEDGGTDTTPEAGEIDFPWNRGRPSEDELPISSLIGKIRIVPIARQNALLVLARPEHRAAIATTVESLDQPGRQVLILATVAEVSVDTLTKLGIRWGSSRNIIDSADNDNAVNITGGIDSTKTDLLPGLFSTSVLGLNMDITAVLQALKEDTDSKILSDPRVFTSDNEEAIFFDGQDIPFITDRTVSDTGQTNDSFDYREVGIRLAARPRITSEGNVDMNVDLELSSIVPGQTLFGGAIVDRRQTTSRVTIRDRQTIVISGIIREEQNEIIRKVPLLGDIPLIGLIFRSKENRTQQTDLVAFITPIILDNPDTSNEFFEADRSWLREQFRVNSGLPANSMREFGSQDKIPPTHGSLDSYLNQNGTQSDSTDTTPNGEDGE